MRHKPHFAEIRSRRGHAFYRLQFHLSRSQSTSKMVPSNSRSNSVCIRRVDPTPLVLIEKYQGRRAHSPAQELLPATQRAEVSVNYVSFAIPE